MDAAAVVATTSAASPLPRKRKFDPEDTGCSASTSPLATFNNIMNMSQLLGQLSGVGAGGQSVSADNVENGLPELSSALGMTHAQLQSLISASTAGPSSASSSPEPASDLPTTGKALRLALESFGLDLVEQFFDDIHTVKAQIDFLPDSVIAEVCQVDCPNCSDVFGSLWLLKTHATEVHSSSLPLEAVQQFSEKLKSAIADNKDRVSSANGPDAKRSKIEKITSSLKANKLSASKPVGNAIPNGKKLSNGTSPAEVSTSASGSMPNLAMMQMMAGAAGLPMFMPHIFSMMNPADMFSGSNTMTSTAGTSNGAVDNSAYGQQRRARTKITDDQLKVLKTYFDISNSPTEGQVKEMSIKTGLAEKVIKHWFRNTLFKERQRDKDSPYNFNVPPQLSIDLDTYEKTGETKVKTVVKAEDADDFSIQSTPPTTVPTPTPSITSNAPPKLSCAGGIKAEVDDSGQTSQEAFVNAASEFMAHLNKAVNNNFVNPFALLGPGAMSDGNSPLSLVNPNSALDGQHSSNGSSSNSGTGRRANRTRFTDVQLRSLQQFFDKQAYPKDDDLEMLSKRLNLSPRVIVVWFQNARQKARKIYENTPNCDNNERFIRTPGQNFQCKRCQLVFPRYYELIQHQQKVCYKNDTDKQRADNKSVDEQLSDEEKPTTSYDNGNTVTATVTAGAPLNLAGLPGNEEPNQPVPSSMETLAQLVNGNASTDSESSIVLPQPATCSSEDLFKLLTSANPSDTLAKLLGTPSASVMPTALPSSNERFAKRCPFCVTAIFTSRSRLTEHMATKHMEQIRIANVDIDALPDVPEDEMNQSSTTSSFNNSDPLDLTSSSRGSPAPGERRDSLNGLTGYNDADFDFSSVLSSVSPSMLASGLFTNNGFNMPIRTPSAGGSASGSQGNAKRYRTHLTPLQVFVMKALFNDYKTPSMTECDILGNEIGLNKRVVQVWFQNARAKERKCRSVGGDEDLPKTSTDGCNICGVEFHGKASKTTMQDHIFTKKHINVLAERFNSRSSSAQRESGSSNSNYRRDGSTSPSESADRPRPRAVRDTSIRKPVSTTSGNTRPSSASGFASQFPFGMMYGGLPPFMDPTVIGTPITALQIPSTVMQQITNDIAAGKESTLFTQDGLHIHSLRAQLSESDAKLVQTTTAEVGYACPGCSHTFQVQPALEAHQKMLCTTSEGKVFKLRQSYYECQRCATKVGTQDEFKRHVETPAHIQMQ
uniref:Homeobox domain-containing protein n=1 Tax=Panagrellus redivivus TaxID=6233 RepID=A0A7E4VWX3_PANRE